MTSGRSLANRDPFRILSLIRALARLPEKVAVAVVEFLYGSLAASPHRAGQPLRLGLEGLHSARREQRDDRQPRRRVDQLIEPDRAHGLAAFGYDRKTEASLLSHAVDLDHILAERYPGERLTGEFHERYMEAWANLRQRAHSSG